MVKSDPKSGKNNYDYLTSVAMMHSFFSSAMTNTDWYMDSREEHMVDILHSGLSLWSKKSLNLTPI